MKELKIECQEMELVNGFPYRFGSAINKRKAIEEKFLQVCKRFNSSQIEVPLAAPVNCFIGSRPRPLSERNSQRVFKGHTPDGASMAIRYEGTALTAAYIANEIKESRFDEQARNHYFQEMVRLEYLAELDSTHWRSFYQAGIEMFSVNEELHQKSITECIEVMYEFLCSLGDMPKIRISHVDVMNIPLKKMGLNRHDTKKVRKLVEAKNENALIEFLSKLEINKTLGAILIDITQMGLCSLEDGIVFLVKYPEMYRTVIQDLQKLSTGMDLDVAKKCFFDGGIDRSLDFYSGLVFQCDLNGVIECAGGGEYTGLVESFDVEQRIYSVGMAAGVERLIQVK